MTVLGVKCEAINVELSDLEVDMLHKLYPKLSVSDALKLLIREKCSQNISQEASASKGRLGF